MKFLAVLLLILKILLLVESKVRITYYATIGSNAQLTCQSGGGPYICFSTYTFENLTYPMIMINTTSKYTVGMNSITINNVDATDAGFYACSSNCNQMNSNLVDFYLMPMCMLLANSIFFYLYFYISCINVAGQQPIDTSQNFIAIPPYYGPGISYIDANNLYVPIAPNQVPVIRGRVLSKRNCI